MPYLVWSTSIDWPGLLIEHDHMVHHLKVYILHHLLCHDNNDVKLACSCCEAFEQVLGCWEVLRATEVLQGLVQEQQGRACDQLGGHSCKLAL